MRRVATPLSIVTALVLGFLAFGMPELADVPVIDAAFVLAVLAFLASFINDAAAHMRAATPELVREERDARVEDDRRHRPRRT